MNSTWKCLPVREFINQCNWKPTISSSTARSSAQRQQSLNNWQCLTIRDFFSLQNWSGNADFADSRGADPSVVPDFSLTLPTEKFWQCFSWSGVKSSPSPEKVEQIIEDTEKTIAQVKDFSLNDLSQLF